MAPGGLVAGRVLAHVFGSPMRALARSACEFLLSLRASQLRAPPLHHFRCPSDFPLPTQRVAALPPGCLVDTSTTSCRPRLALGFS